MRYFWMALLFCGDINVSGAFETEPFDAALLPVGFRAVYHVNGNAITILPGEPGEWNVASYSPEGGRNWRSGISLSENERVFHSLSIGENLIIFTNTADYESKTATLNVYQTAMSDGKITKRAGLWKRKVMDPVSRRTKARYIASEELEIASIRSAKAEVFFQYRFDIRVSPTGKVIMASALDYSQTFLRQEWMLFHFTFESAAEGSTDIDDLAYLYDYHVNDKSEVFQLVVNSEENMQVLRFSPDGKDYEMLQLTAGNSVRDDLRLIPAGNDKVYALGKAEADDAFYGVIYAVMDFEKMEVDRVHFEPLPIEMQNTADSLMAAGKEGVNNWMMFKLTKAALFNDEELMVVFETFDLRRSGHVFRDIEIASNLPWKEHKAKITTGPAMIYSFDKSDELRWSKYLYKKQQSSENALPQVSGLAFSKPEKEKLSILLGDQSRPYLHRMDYIYDSRSENQSIEGPGIFIPDWSENEVKVFYSEKDKKLIIQN